MSRRERAFVNKVIGLDEVVAMVQRFSDGALRRCLACPSLLLIARPGAGKSTLGPAIAEYFDTKCHELPAGKDLSPRELCEALLALEAYDFLLIDEGHSLNSACQELLHLALDKQLIPKVTAKGKLNRRDVDSILPFTLLLATNEPGRVGHALRSRLTPIEFGPYRLKSLITIAQVKALEHGFRMTGQAARVLAESAQGSPRTICNYHSLLRVYWPDADLIRQEHVKEFIKRLGINEDGLTPYQREYLLALYAKPNGAASIERLRAQLRVDPEMIRQEYEPYLIERGLIELNSGRGRTLTDEGKKLAKKYKSEDDSADQAAVAELKLEEEE